MNDAAQVRRLIFTRWWFLIGVIILTGLAWYLNGYFAWKGAQIERNQENVLAYTYWKFSEQQSKALEQAYKRDTYGGETPEETLRLFIEALEKKDYELAAKYFVPENQKSMLSDLRAGDQKGNQYFIDAYRKGQVNKPIAQGSSGIYEIEVFPVDSNVSFSVQITKNDYTGKWKIIEL